MIDVRADQGTVQITMPTGGMSAEQVNDFVTWLQVEPIAWRSKFTPPTAWQLSEDIKAGWWDRNQQGLGE